MLPTNMTFRGRIVDSRSKCACYMSKGFRAYVILELDVDMGVVQAKIARLWARDSSIKHS